MGLSRISGELVISLRYDLSTASIFVEFLLIKGSAEAISLNAIERQALPKKAKRLF